jgi:hypothetical protein
MPATSFVGLDCVLSAALVVSLFLNFSHLGVRHAYPLNLAQSVAVKGDSGPQTYLYNFLSADNAEIP